MRNQLVTIALNNASASRSITRRPRLHFLYFPKFTTFTLPLTSQLSAQPQQFNFDTTQTTTQPLPPSNKVNPQSTKHDSTNQNQPTPKPKNVKQRLLPLRLRALRSQPSSLQLAHWEILLQAALADKLTIQRSYPKTCE